MSEILVLGAGMVGVGAALALQARGQSVTLLEKRAPGEETSYGNAGIIQTEAAEPLAMPRDLISLWNIASGRTNDVVWHLAAMPEYLRPLLRYYLNSAPARHHVQAQTWCHLTRRASDDHAPLIAAAGVENLIRHTGFRNAYRDGRSFEKEVHIAERIGREYGVPFTALDGDALAREEPGLKLKMAGAVHWTGSWTCRSPGDLVKAYAQLFVSRGGRQVSGDAMTLAQDGAGWRCESADGQISAEQVVVALGPWSAALVAKFGYRVPLFRKRGYHWHLQPGSGPKLSFLDSANGAFLAVMNAGIRVTTGAEITGFSAPPCRRQIDRGIVAARELFDLGPTVEPAPWYGSRPCLPDMLPLVGPAPRHKGLWFDFGHAHQGFTLGPTTGILLADQMTGGPNPEFMRPLGYRWA